MNWLDKLERRFGRCAIHNLMYYCQISEEEFKQKIFVQNDIEPLYFPYYEYVRSHPIKKWQHRTYILRGELDTIC